MFRWKKQPKEKQYLFTLWYDDDKKLEITITGWEVDGGFLYLTSEDDVRGIRTERVREFLVRDMEEES